MKKDQVLKLYKKVGETPLECLNRFKKGHPKFRNEKMTYAGRLDPLAEGELLVLVGESCKNKEKYLKLDKEYEMDILFGFETDTYDLLGLLLRQERKSKIIRASPIFSEEKGLPALHNLTLPFLTKIPDSFTKKFSQPYPPYSSKLFSKARAGTLDKMEIPEKKVEIYKIKLLETQNISKKYLSNYIKKCVGSVKGDFRQKKILSIWAKTLAKTKVTKFPVVSIKVKCSSGTYMRSLAHNIGKEVQVPALALRIKRTRIYR